MRLLSNLLSLCFLLLSFSLFGQLEGDAPMTEVKTKPSKKLANCYFPGCEVATIASQRAVCTNDKIKQHIYANLKRPDAIRNKKGILSAKLEFKIDRTGNVVDVVLKDDPGFGCGEAALAAVRSLPQLTVPDTTKYRVQERPFLGFSILFTSDDRFYERIINTPVSIDTTRTEEIYRVVEQMPEFPGCESETDKNKRKQCATHEMLKFIYKNLEYPKEARSKATQGIVVIRYIVEKDGTISDPQIVRDVGYGCGEEALRVVNSMPKWNPGIQRGKKVPVYFNLPVKFKLE